MLELSHKLGLYCMDGDENILIKFAFTIDRSWS